ncbi:MAG TPA: aroma-sacti cluster domain-containing protein [Holophagaceae bacterium]|nr:aroma-sacti cluster domain-containing protein [Holophagaceae bacterium]
MSNMDTLVQAGVIKDASQVSADMQAKVNALTPEEITHLISVKAKLGEDGLQAHNGVMML